MPTNALSLTGTITTIDALRHTPAGVPIVSFTLRHQSLQSEAGNDRQTAFEVAAVTVGEAAKSAAAFHAGDQLSVRGFLAARTHKGAQIGTQLVLHVTHIETFSDKQS